MAFSYPLGLPTFWDGLKVSSLRFNLGEAMSVSETGGGEILPARVGQRLWSGEASIISADPGAQDQALALVDLIRQPGATFLVYDHRRTAPAADPDGAAQGASVCRVASVAVNRREITLKGLAAGFTLTRGDLVSIAYGASPVRFFLARVVQGGAFSGAPATLQVEVAPAAPADLGLDDVVTLQKPYCKAVYVPDSFTAPTRRPGLDGGFSFQWRQTLR